VRVAGFDVAKTGVGRIGFIGTKYTAKRRGYELPLELTLVHDTRLCLAPSAGFPSVGKSTLMTKLTGTHSEVAAYEFTTLTTVPGVLQVRGAKFQVSLVATLLWPGPLAILPTTGTISTLLVRSS